MAKFKAYDYRQRVFLPVSWEYQLMPGTLEFAIRTLVETRLDTSGLEQQYRNDETGRTAYDPKILLKIILLGDARGLISSRKIEPACRENVIVSATPCSCGVLLPEVANQDISGCQSGSSSPTFLSGWPARWIVNWGARFPRNGLPWLNPFLPTSKPTSAWIALPSEER
jgi:hypothetical protein